MPVTDAAVLTAIVAAFVAFGVVLAWGEYQNSEYPSGDPSICCEH